MYNVIFYLLKIGKIVMICTDECLIYHQSFEFFFCDIVEVLCIHLVIFRTMVLLERERELELKSENLSVNHNFTPIPGELYNLKRVTDYSVPFFV